MKDKEKQIVEELSNDIYSLKSCDTSFEENCKLLAYDLVTLGWIKPNENSVVLSKAKYEMLVACSSYEGIMRKLQDEYIRGSKETAEKILKWLKENYVGNMFFINIFFKEQFDIEIKE